VKKRQQEIYELLQGAGEATVKGLARRFDVSVMTIRRDLSFLEQLGLIIRTHGGAILSRRSVIEFSFQQRGRSQAAEKRAIAATTAGLVRPGMTVTLDTGTTTLEVARAVAEVRGLTVLTSSLAIASVLYAHENITLILLGGTVHTNSPDLFGPLTEENLRRFRVELAVVGADAVGPDGLFTTDLEVAQVSRAMVAGAEHAVLVADHSKFQDTAFVKFADWDMIDHVVTDAGIAPEVCRWLEEVVEVVTYAGG